MSIQDPPWRCPRLQMSLCCTACCWSGMVQFPTSACQCIQFHPVRGPGLCLSGTSHTSRRGDVHACSGIAQQSSPVLLEVRTPGMRVGSVAHAPKPEVSNAGWPWTSALPDAWVGPAPTNPAWSPFSTDVFLAPEATAQVH